jgi:PAS domain S-box-containing protein
MAAKRIMIVEDDGVIALQIKNALVRMGYLVPMSAISGEKAIEGAPEARPDLVLMDVRLAGKMDGVEAARQLRALYDIPIIYLTAYSDDELLQRAQETEPYSYLIKPFKERDLQAAIEMTLYKHEMDRKLRESEELYRLLFEHCGDAIMLESVGGQLLRANPAACRMFGYTEEELIQAGKAGVLGPDDPRLHAALTQRANTGIFKGELTYVRKDGTSVHCEVTSLIFEDSHGKSMTCTIIHDITERKMAEQALNRAKAELEIKVKERTSEVAAKAHELEHFNTALKTLLKQREADKEELEESLLTNVRNLIVPYLEKLKMTRLRHDQAICVSILESHIADIISPFVRRLSQNFERLAPAEIRIAKMIRDGKTTKEMANLLHLSEFTVQKHRQRIRAKLDLRNNKINLRSYLETLQ